VDHRKVVARASAVIEKPRIPNPTDTSEAPGYQNLVSNPVSPRSPGLNPTTGVGML
jgi:hypothetical protein